MNKENLHFFIKNITPPIMSLDKNKGSFELYVTSLEKAYPEEFFECKFFMEFEDWKISDLRRVGLRNLKNILLLIDKAIDDELSIY